MGKIVKITGPVVVAAGMKNSKIYDVALVGELGLLGEVIQLKGDKAIIQVYEDTNGLKPGEPVKGTGMPLSVELGPGLLTTIYDGIGRPLLALAKKTGNFIGRGITADTIDKKKKYDFKPLVKVGDAVGPGSIIGSVEETQSITHKILVPPDALPGKITKISKGKFTVEEIVAVVKTKKGDLKLQMYHKWPVRKPRPINTKLSPEIPLITGQRVFDTFFPLAKGGTAAIPGPFGAGKTVSQHQLAKWSDAQIVVYVGCGERGNEMTDVLTEFPELQDPKTGKPLMDRTVLIANTSNMPVAAREASIYTGITIGEYFRDMGYDVALMADSTSRWAEALREISSRLEEMPGEEGYPAYLASRLAQFYERACRADTLAGNQGSVSIIGAVSPPGGDFSEPVTQNTTRLTKILWGLDANLAYSRHFPAINWLTSYSLYTKTLAGYFESQVGSDFNSFREEAMKLLQKESELKEIVQLVGPDALKEEDKLVMYTAGRLREDFLQQLATHEIDTFCSLDKQYLMLKMIMETHKKASRLVESGVKVTQISALPLTEAIGRMKYVQKYKEEIKNVEEQREKEFQKLVGGHK